MVRFVLVVSFYFPLFETEAYNTENYKQSPNNAGVSFINKKSPVRRLFEPGAFHCRCDS